MERIKSSIGIFAHNEAGNILNLLTALTGQKTSVAEIAEIIVVSSASTDGTDETVTAYAAEYPLVRLITQAKREGKSAAINLFLAEAKQEILVIISGDVIPSEHTIEKLVSAFSDAKLGACGGRPVPVNQHDTFMGYAVHLLWRLHHRMALISPKLGEMIAFRKVMESIPRDSAVDEASIEAIVRSQGLSLRYIPDAIIHNKGPETMSDFIKQRRRIQNGHLWLQKHQAYKVVSQDTGTLLRIMLSELKDSPTDAAKLFGVMGLEMFCRLLGSWDYHVRKKNPFTWEIVRSAKN
jgi:cellulose synthase/poly-beta-1,6-N-acetylglucosamine synthase-like glycosyltransferase